MVILFSRTVFLKLFWPQSTWREHVTHRGLLAPPITHDRSYLIDGTEPVYNCIDFTVFSIKIKRKRPVTSVQCPSRVGPQICSAYLLRNKVTTTVFLFTTENLMARKLHFYLLLLETCFKVNLALPKPHDSNVS